MLYNLAVAHIESRTEDSPDIKAHSFNRVVEEKILDLGPELEDVKNRFFRVLGRVFNRLKALKVIYFANVESLQLFPVLQNRDQFRQNPPAEIANNNAKRSMVETDFHILVSLLYSGQYLHNHSARSFYKSLKKGLLERHLKVELGRSEDFQTLVDFLREKYGDATSLHDLDDNAPPPIGPDELAAAHPKLEVV